ncbi:maleylacetate reductase [Amycolatopsis sp. NPDC059235]|uniref:maleylacetate reductase n=1 Tax=Amycolatopsis sp. NPDC059235 TaxID=3346782 RepID=UPI0036715A88
MMDSFTYEALPMRVVFGSGALSRIAEETDRLGLRRVLVLSTPEQRDLADRVAAVLGDRAAGVFDQARPHVPVPTVAAASRAAAESRADGCVAAGGGSTIGLGKALALRQDLPVVALPTTYAGSEMTPIWGLTENHRKQTGRDRKVLPRSVVYDPNLTASLPATVAATSGLNAIAHAVEALYAPDVSPVIAAMAEQGVRDLASNFTGPAALRGAWLCGACLGATTMGLHHKLCHVLGGMLDLPHAETHAILLPHVAAFNLPAAPDATAALSRALNTDDPAAALGKLTADTGAPTNLAALGVTQADLASVVNEVLANPYANPRPVHRPDLEALLHRAFRPA